MREAMAEMVLQDAEAHLYGPVLGLPELREELATRWSAGYEASGHISAAHVGITSGCNQAFAAAISTLGGEEDEVILPTPWYFNHKMWLDMAGMTAVPLPCGPSLLPDPDQAARLITSRTKAIALVSPNNPSGKEYSADLVQAFFDLARQHKIALVLDETYRDFDSRSGSPHALFQDPNWDDTLIHLYSFSKAYRLTGHRVGAMVCAPTRLAEAEKFLDTVTICPNQLGQRAALWGMRNLGDWLAAERLEILDRRAAIEEDFPRLDAAHGYQLLGCGAYFAYVKHAWAGEIASDKVAKEMVGEAGILALPGTMFTPEGDTFGAQTLRIAFANIDRGGISTLFDRLYDLAL